MPHVISSTVRFENVITGMALTINGTLRANNVGAAVVTLDGTLIADNFACADLTMTAGTGNSIFASNLATAALILNGGSGFQDVIIDGLRTGPNEVVIDGAFVEFSMRGAVIGQKSSSPSGVSLLDVTGLDEFTIEATIYRSALHGAVFDACENGLVDLHIVDASAASDNTSDGVSLTGVCDGLTLRGAVRGAALQANNPRYGVDVGASCTDINICMDISGAQTGDINDGTSGEVEVCSSAVLGEETPSAMIGGFGVENLAASLTDSQLFRQIQSVQAQVSVVAAHAGSVIGISVASNEARTAGTATFEVFVNGTGTGLTCVLDATDTTFASAAQAAGLDAVAVGDRIDVRVTTSGTWAPTTADVEALVMLAGG